MNYRQALIFSLICFGAAIAFSATLTIINGWSWEMWWLPQIILWALIIAGWISAGYYRGYIAGEKAVTEVIPLMLISGMLDDIIEKSNLLRDIYSLSEEIDRTQTQQEVKEGSDEEEGKT